MIEGTFKFFRPNLETGSDERFMSITIQEGRIVGVRRFSPRWTEDTTAHAMEEEIRLVFHTISWSYEGGGHNTEFEDSWSSHVAGG